MTHYLVTVWRGSEMVRELWNEIEKHGQCETSAKVYALQLERDFDDFEYTVRPVTDQELREAITA